MGLIILILACIATLLGLLDLLFWNYTERYRSHVFLQWAVVIVSVAIVLMGIKAMLPTV